MCVCILLRKSMRFRSILEGQAAPAISVRILYTGVLSMTTGEKRWQIWAFD